MSLVAPSSRTRTRTGQIFFPKRWIKCAIGKGDLSTVREAIYRIPDCRPGAQRTPDDRRSLKVKKLAGTRHRDLYRLRVGDYRIFYRMAGQDVLVLRLDRRDDNVFNNLGSIERTLVLHHGSGVTVVEVGAHLEEPYVAPETVRRATTIERENPLTVFSTPELQRAGLDAETVQLCRTLVPSIDIAQTLASRVENSDIVELTAAMWYDPERYLTIFEEGRSPTVDDARLHEAELVERIASDESSSAIVALDENELHGLLQRSIEEWMFYLHPSQTRIVRHVANGPSRVQGGPGTGKTVAALHRAKYLAESGRAERILLTTFVNLLPGVWTRLLETFAPEAAGRMTTRTVDALARAVVVAADGVPSGILGSGDRKRRDLLDRAMSRTPGLRGVFASTANFEREIDEVIAGRGLDLTGYLAVAREGRGAALREAERRIVWSGYEHYRAALQATGATDWPSLRMRAFELARAGEGPRFDAIVVDEAQDLTEVQLRLLMELDESADHRGLMLVGDGRQAIFPGGFRLSDVGLRVVGRSFTLTTNWRNTQWIADVAHAAFGDSDYLDLETGERRRSTAESPLPVRLGDPPQLHVVPGSSEGGEVMRMLVEDALATSSLADIGVLARTKKTLDWAEKTLRSAGHDVVRLDDYKGEPVDGVRVGTFAKSKGLEFKLVILAAVGSSSWAVRPFWLRDPSEIGDWWATELRTFYVAMTRARDGLALLTGPELSPPVIRAREYFDEWDWC